MTMTTNSPNPVDGDVQALVERCQKHLQWLKDNAAFYPDNAESLEEDRLIHEVALAALEAEPVAWIVMAPQGDYIERNPDVVAHLEGTGLAKCKPLYTTPPAQLLRPVDLSQCKKLWYEHDDHSAEIVCIPIKEIKKALRQQGFEVKSCLNPA